MMLVKKLYCDRCGEEITDRVKRYTVTLEFGEHNADLDDYGTVNRAEMKDLCEACYYDMLKMFEPADPVPVEKEQSEIKTVAGGLAAVADGILDGFRRLGELLPPVEDDVAQAIADPEPEPDPVPDPEPVRKEIIPGFGEIILCDPDPEPEPEPEPKPEEPAVKKPKKKSRGKGKGHAYVSVNTAENRAAQIERAMDLFAEHAEVFPDGHPWAEPGQGMPLYKLLPMIEPTWKVGHVSADEMTSMLVESKAYRIVKQKSPNERGKLRPWLYATGQKPLANARYLYTLKKYAPKCRALINAGWSDSKIKEEIEFVDRLPLTQEEMDEIIAEVRSR